MSKRVMSSKSMRNLPQYKDMTDDQFEAFYYQTVLGIEKDQLILERFDRIMKQFEDEFDLSELLPNDRILLKQLINALILQEDYQNEIFNLKKKGISDNLYNIEKINKMLESINGDISRMQDDLKITRKIRKSDKEQSVISYLNSLKERAAKFSEQKMHYVLCPKCGILLATVWWLYPEHKTSKMIVTCHHKLADGNVCGTIVAVDAKTLFENGGSNRPELLPEGMR